MATARRRTPALRPWRTYAHPRRSPATPAGKPGPAVHTVTGQLTSEPPTRRRCIRPTPDRVKGACGAPDRRDDAAGVSGLLRLEGHADIPLTEGTATHTMATL